MSALRFGQSIVTALATVAAPVVTSSIAVVSWPVLLGIGATVAVIGVGVAAAMASGDNAASGVNDSKDSPSSAPK